MNSCSSLVIFVLLCLINLYRSDDIHWDYGEIGPDVWKDYFSACGGHSQSPINIKTACTTYQPFEPFQFSSTYDLIQNFTLTNNGHTIAATQIDKDLFPLNITGGGLSGTYEFVNFHLHWGENYKSGSEHQVNGEKFAGEIHFVHRHTTRNELAVLGIFMQSDPPGQSNSTTIHRRKRKREVSNSSNTIIQEWDRYFATAAELQSTNSSDIMSLRLSTLMGTDLNNFWRYSGSLTTPMCTENVIWTMFQIPLSFTHSGLANFRKNFYPQGYRGPQPLYDRIVYRNYINVTAPLIPDYACCAKSGNSSVIPFNDSASLLVNKQLSLYFCLFLFTLIFNIFLS